MHQAAKAKASSRKESRREVGVLNAMTNSRFKTVRGEILQKFGFSDKAGCWVCMLLGGSLCDGDLLVIVGQQFASASRF